MLKTAMEYLLGLGQAELHEENGQTYSDKPLHLLREPTANPFTVHSLSGLVEYLKSEYEWDERLMVHIVSPTEVQVFDALNGNANRNRFIQAEALTPSFDFDRFYDVESFNIKLQSTFVKNEDRDIVLKVVGNVREEDVKSFSDDGVSQMVTAKAGAASVAEVVVPNPVALKPFRTFVEVEQPVSAFVFRMQSGREKPNCALFEADGGAWKLQAMRNIERYLHEKLATEISAEKLVIIA